MGFKGLVLGFVASISAAAMAAGPCDGYGLREVAPSNPRPAHYESNLWKIRSPKGDEGVVLGLIHTTDKRVVLGYEALNTISIGSEYYFPEVSLAQESLSAMGSAEIDRSSVIDQLTPEQSALLKKILSGRNTDAASIANKKDWAVTSELSRPLEYGASIDLLLYQQNVGLKKQIVPLEAMSSLIDNLNSFPNSRQVTLDTVCGYEQVNQQAEAMKDAYIKQDWARFSDESERWESVNQKVSDLYHQRLVLDRNQIMAQTILNTLKGGQKFVLTVGMMHLSGSQGLLTLLEKSGYSVQPIKVKDLNAMAQAIQAPIVKEKQSVMKDLAERLKTLVSDKIPDQLPELRVLNSFEFYTAACGGMLCPATGFYSDKVISLHMSLLPGLLKNDPAVFSQILRQMVHWEQDVNAADQKSWCDGWREGEVQAQMAQSAYLQQAGLPSPPFMMNEPPAKCRGL